MALGSLGHKDHGKHTKHNRLDQADEKFQHQEPGLCQNRHQSPDDKQQDRTGKDISKQPEGEREKLGEF